MRTLEKSLVLSALALTFAAPLALAQAATVTCSDSLDNVQFTANVYQLYLNTSKDFSSFYFSIYTDLSKENEVLHDEYLTSYAFDSCSFSPSNGTVPENLHITDSVLAVTPTGTYTQATFTFTTLSLGPESSAKIALPKTPLTAEERRKELAAFKASIPAFAGVPRK